VIIACLALLSVAAVVANVIGFFVIAGWKHGPGECIAGIIVIGLAVDYAIHLGHSYLEAAHLGLEKCEERWEFALNIMGITVIAGAITTFVSAIMMECCQIIFRTDVDFGGTQFSTLSCRRFPALWQFSGLLDHRTRWEISRQYTDSCTISCAGGRGHERGNAML